MRGKRLIELPVHPLGEGNLLLLYLFILVNTVHPLDGGELLIQQ